MPPNRPGGRAGETEVSMASVMAMTTWTITRIVAGTATTTGHRAPEGAELLKVAAAVTAAPLSCCINRIRKHIYLLSLTIKVSYDIS